MVCQNTYEHLLTRLLIWVYGVTLHISYGYRNKYGHSCYAYTSARNDRAPKVMLALRQSRCGGCEDSLGL